MPRPAPLTRRLLAALESHAREDAGPIALADWAALSGLFDRELALLTRLAAAVESERAADDPELRGRAEALRERYDRRSHVLSTAARALDGERQSLRIARHRTRAVRTAYTAA